MARQHPVNDTCHKYLARTRHGPYISLARVLFLAVKESGSYILFKWTEKQLFLPPGPVLQGPPEKEARLRWSLR